MLNSVNFHTTIFSLTYYGKPLSIYQQVEHELKHVTGNLIIFDIMLVNMEESSHFFLVLILFCNIMGL